jgi:hypothetical protein
MKASGGNARVGGDKERASLRFRSFKKKHKVRKRTLGGSGWVYREEH